MLGKQDHTDESNNSLESTQAIQNPAEPAAATNAFIKATWVDALDSGLDIAERLLDDHLHHHQVRTLAESATASTEFNRADKAGLIEAGFDLGRHLLKDHGH